MHEKQQSNSRIYKFNNRKGTYLWHLTIYNFNDGYDWKCKIDQDYYDPDNHLMAIL